MTALINPSLLTDDEPRLGAVPFVDERPKRKKKARLAAAPKAPTVSLVVPALNEERNIAWVLERVPACVDRDPPRRRLLHGPTRCRWPARCAPDVVVVTQRGRGKGAALRTGFEASSGDFIVAIDADGSMEPAEIEYYVTALGQGYDVVKGSRHLRAVGRWTSRPCAGWATRAGRGRQRDCGAAPSPTSATASSGSGASSWTTSPCTARGFEIETELAVHAVNTGLRIAEVPSVELLRHYGDVPPQRLARRPAHPPAAGPRSGCRWPAGHRPHRPTAADRRPA